MVASESSKVVVVLNCYNALQTVGRDLEVLKRNMSVKELKKHINGQGKIYINPIQRSLSTISLVSQRNE